MANPAGKSNVPFPAGALTIVAVDHRRDCPMLPAPHSFARRAGGHHLNEKRHYRFANIAARVRWQVSSWEPGSGVNQLDLGERPRDVAIDDLGAHPGWIVVSPRLEFPDPEPRMFNEPEPAVLYGDFRTEESRDRAREFVAP